MMLKVVAVGGGFVKNAYFCKMNFWAGRAWQAHRCSPRRYWACRYFRTFKIINNMKKTLLVLMFCIVGALSSFGQNGQEECGLFPIKKDGKWGYIDKTGKVVIEPQFDRAAGFSEGLAFVWIGNKGGWIDKTGNIIYSWEDDTGDEGLDLF